MDKIALYGFLADVVLIVHALFVLVVVAGQALILIGGWRGWVWTRRLVLRWTHLLTICVVVAESWVGMECPLTTWESALRRMAGQTAYTQSFVADWVGRLLFYRAPDWVFATIYTAFGLLVVITFYLYPPHRGSGYGKMGKDNGWCARS